MVSERIKRKDLSDPAELLQGPFYEVTPEFLEEVGKLIRPALEAQSCPMPELPTGVTAEMTCPACPVQIEGTADGKHFYFRARGEWWRIGFGDTSQDAVMADAFREGPYDEGSTYGAGWMPHSEAWRLVLDAVEAWRRERGGDE